MKQIRINVPLTVRHTVLTPLGSDMMISRIEAEHNGVSVLISGMRDAVDGALSLGAPSDPHSLIQRALATLGYVVGDHAKDVEQFSRWVDHLAAFPRSDEAKTLWTEAMLRAAQSPYPIGVSDASRACLELVLEQMRLFPPTPKTGLDDGPPLSDVISTDIHISAMKIANDNLRLWVDLTGCKTPKDAARALARLREWEQAAKQCGWSSPFDFRGHTASDDAELQEWRTIAKEFGWDSPSGMRGVSEQIRQWQDISDKATLRSREWAAAAKANGIDSPKELAESTTMSFGQFVDRKVSREWQEATGCANAFQAQKKLAELEAKLLSYASEIDALRKTIATPTDQFIASMQPYGSELEKRLAAERDLAKVRAELQTKCREAQTERERADTAESMFRVEQAKRESEVRAEKERADNLAEELRECDGIISKAREFAGLAQHDTKSIVDWCYEVREKLATAIVPLPKPEKVEPGQKWARIACITSVGNWGVIERATMGSEQPTLASLRNDNNWTYLGT